MVYLYTGTPGSGKSLHSAKVIAEYMSSNAPVICNFPVKKSALKKISSQIKNKGKLPIYYWSNDVLTPDRLVAFSQEYFSDHKYKEGHLLLIIDECQLIFNAREWQKNGRGEWLSFFTQHRKLGYDIMLVAQFDRMIDRQIRSLVEYEYIHRQVKHWGWQGKLFTLGGIIPLFCVVQRYYPLNERISVSFFLPSKKIYKIYDTNYMFDAQNVEGAK